jgi:Outer membrane protein beta-barrel domain
MNKTIALLLTSLSVSIPVFAGEEIQSKDYSKDLAVEPVFKDHELQSDTFAVYGVGNGPTHIGLFHDHAWGDGSGFTYYFNRYIGIGVEYSSNYTRESPDTNFGRESRHEIDTFSTAGNLYFRYPIESLRLAPYAFVGGGANFADRKYASADVGVGLEYRITPPRLGWLTPSRLALFMDARWNYLGDRYFPDDNSSRGDLNYFSIRAGLRVVY